MTLEDIIREHVVLGNPTPSGWHTVRCLVCNDHEHKRRGGFLFDHNSVAYNCFNCNTRAVFDGQGLSDKMKAVLNAFSVPEQDYNRIVFEAHKNKQQPKKPKTKTENLLVPKEIPLPSFFVPLDHTDDRRIIDELDRRQIKLSDYPFYVAHNDQSDGCKGWLDRLIIPFYHHQRLIFYQGRDLTGDPKRIKYKNTDVVGRQKIFYGYDEIERNTDEPLYIVEGFFDAFHIRGIATLSNVLTKEQIQVLARSKRPKVVIPDRRGDGHKMAYQGLDNGWSVSIADVGGCKDISDAIAKYGTIYVLQSIVERTMTGFEARIAIELYCEKSKGNNNGKSVHRKGH
jgi:hypothetical protein